MCAFRTDHRRYSSTFGPICVAVLFKMNSRNKGCNTSVGISEVESRSGHALCGPRSLEVESSSEEAYFYATDVGAVGEFWSALDVSKSASQQASSGVYKPWSFATARSRWRGEGTGGRPSRCRRSRAPRLRQQMQNGGPPPCMLEALVCRECPLASTLFETCFTGGLGKRDLI